MATDRNIKTDDICDKCGLDFGLSGDDADGGYNSRCVNCGNNTYTTESEETNGNS